MSLNTLYGSSKDKYLKLIHTFPLRRIRSDAECDEATAIIDRLVDQNSLTEAETDYLDALSDFVHKYETAQQTIPAVTDAEMLAHLIEAQQVTQAELAEQTGIAPSTISAVLSGKRNLNRSHITLLCRFFGVGPGVFSLV